MYMKERKCTFCKQRYPLDRAHFAPVKTVRFRGFMYCCRKCDRIRQGKRGQKLYASKPEYYKAKTKEWKLKNPEKRKAHEEVHKAIKLGILKKRSCETCGKAKSVAHHEDYTKPLDVIWLCGSHHRRLHMLLNSAPNSN